MPLLLEVIIHGIHDILLPILHDAPDGPSYHVPCGEGGQGEPLPLHFQHHSLVIFQLGDLLECGINIVQGEEGEVLNVVPGLDEGVQGDEDDIVDGDYTIPDKYRRGTSGPSCRQAQWRTRDSSSPAFLILQAGLLSITYLKIQYLHICCFNIALKLK